ncbi:MAG: sugar phosphate isomerase/epimerase family protein [Thermodesulfobacteriota bacterium]
MMNLGYRIFDDTYIDKFALNLVQISVWYNRDEDFQRVSQLAQRLRQMGKRFVIHPTSTYLSETKTYLRRHYLDTLKRYAEISDLGLIVHDETLSWQGRLKGDWKDAYMSALNELEQICNVSIENACNSSDILWFWQTFAHSITFDIGHFETAGMDCFKVIKSLTKEMIQKLDYIHLHRNNGKKESGITDHWPLVEDCAELKVLKRLLELKPEVRVILEVDREMDIRKSLQVINPKVL